MKILCPKIHGTLLNGRCNIAAPGISPDALKPEFRPLSDGKNDYFPCDSFFHNIIQSNLCAMLPIFRIASHIILNFNDNQIKSICRSVIGSHIKQVISDLWSYMTAIW